MMKKQLRGILKLTLLIAFLVGGLLEAQAQERLISGTVTDAESGETLIGVNITFASDQSQGTVTDIDGNYKLSVPDTLKALSFSYVGYNTQIIEITSTTINVAMSAGETLDEIVVVGYATQKAKEVTSAITSVKSEDFNDGNINDPIQLIQGKVSGLSISRPGADPNGDFTIRLRGLSTFGGNTQPLIIIDGVQGASLKSVDPEDIASMDVLKDASAAAIYGTRAASGVIIITTKRGSYKPGEKQFNVEFNSNVTTENVFRKISVLSASDYLTMPNSTDFGDETNWTDKITRRGVSQAYGLAVNGASETSNYRVSFNYRSGNGVVLGTGYDQLNGRINYTKKALKDKLTFDFNLSSTLRNEEYSPGEAFGFVARYNPTAPTHASDDFSKEWGGYFQREAFAFYNPLAVIEQNTLEGRKIDIIGSLKATYEIIDGLKVSGFYSINQTNNLFGQYWSKNSYWTPYATASHKGFAKKETSDNFNDIFELIGTYEKTFDKLKFKVMGGYSYQNFINESFWAFGEDFLSDGFSYNSLGSASGEISNKESMGSYKSGSTLIGFFGRANLNWDETYFLTANFRRDGSTMFGINNQWGNFPGVSAGIDIAKLVEIPAVDRLKIRGSYGVTGNLPPQPYLAQDLWNVTNENFFYNGQYIQAYAPVRNANPDLKWEVKKEIDIGIDFYLLDFRLGGSIDYYTSTSSDLMLNARVAVPPFPSEWMVLNLGELQNSGLEFAINYKVIQGDNFKWSTDFNFTKYFATKLTKITSELSGSDELFYGYLGAPFLTGVRTIRLVEGGNVGEIIAPIYAGVDSTGAIQIEDIDGDGEQNQQKDVKVVGSGLPTFQLGWGNTFTYKQFYLNFFLRGVFGHSLVNVNNARYGVPVVMGIQSGMEQALDYLDASDGPVYSDVHVEKADFVKLDNFAFGYSFLFPESKYLSKVKVFVSGQNLFTITNYSGTDPEVRYGDAYDNNNPLAPGIDRENTYFSTRSLTFGVNVLF